MDEKTLRNDVKKMTDQNIVSEAIDDKQSRIKKIIIQEYSEDTPQGSQLKLRPGSSSTRYLNSAVAR